MILGGNPSVKEGLPLALDWETLKSECFHVDEYEKTKDFEILLLLIIQSGCLRQELLHT
jgi:hypothetical protein